MDISDKATGASSFIHGQGSEHMTFHFRACYTLSCCNDQEQSGVLHLFKALTMKAASTQYV
jgi:hypothetical protein